MAKKRVTRFDAKVARGEKVRVIIYCRVSTDEQEEKGSSLDTQEKDCISHCSDNGYEVLDVVKETHTGFELEQRKKFMDVMRRCDRGEADAIVFRTYDRLSRDQTHSTVILYDGAKYGYKLLCVKEQFDEENLFERMMRDLTSYFAEFERAKIRERTTNGLIERAQSGKLINGSRPRYGYTYVDEKHTRYKIVESEAEVIHKIDALYLQGYGQHPIADMLTRDGVPTPNGYTIWGHQTVGKILDCTEYHGEGYSYMYEAFTTERGKTGTKVKPIEERIKMPSENYPLIRTKETYLAIQERRAAAHSSALTSNVPQDVLLRGGFIYCAHCGRSMSPNMDRGKYLIYKCHYPANGSRKDVHSVQIAARIIDNAVIDYIRAALKKLDLLEAVLERHIATNSAQVTVESYEEAIAQVTARQMELAQDLKQARGRVRDILIGQMNELEVEKERLKDYKHNVMGDSSRWAIVRSEVETVLNWLRANNSDIDKATFEEKRRMLRVLGLKVLVSCDGPSRYSAYTIKALPVSSTTC